MDRPINPVPLKGKQSSGSAIKWVVDTMKPRYQLPLKRGTYMLGVNQMIVYGHEKTDCFAHVCISPSVTQPTYLRNNTSVMSVKSYIVKKQSVVKDFSHTMEYYMVDFSYTDGLTVWVVDSEGQSLDVSGTFVIELYEV
jgi:hypothetical protein